MESAIAEPILIADDEPDTIEVMSILFEEHNFEPLCAADGFEAIQIAKRRLPQSIILDVGLPGLNGFQVTKLLRKESGLESATIIGVSGYVHDAFLDRAKEAGMDYYLAKPSNLELLLACLKMKIKTNTCTASDLYRWSEEVRAISTGLRQRIAVLSERSRQLVLRAEELCKKHLQKHPFDFR
jgi:CheY-like chemotaxis protein